MHNLSVLLHSLCQLCGYREVSEQCPRAHCIAERQGILRGSLNLIRQPKAMSGETASTGIALSSVAN